MSWVCYCRQATDKVVFVLVWEVVDGGSAVPGSGAIALALLIISRPFSPATAQAVIAWQL